VKSVGKDLEGAEGESELVSRGEISVDIELSLTLISTNNSASSGGLVTFHFIMVWVSSSLSSSLPFYLPPSLVAILSPFYLYLSLLLPTSILAIMPSKAELVKDIYLLLAACHLNDLVMNPEMAQKIFDHWRESLLHLSLCTSAISYAKS
jgi:hypothetical protein